MMYVIAKSITIFTTLNIIINKGYRVSVIIEYLLVLQVFMIRLSKLTEQYYLYFLTIEYTVSKYFTTMSSDLEPGAEGVTSINLETVDKIVSSLNSNRLNNMEDFKTVIFTLGDMAKNSPNNAEGLLNITQKWAKGSSMYDYIVVELLFIHCPRTNTGLDTLYQLYDADGPMVTPVELFRDALAGKSTDDSFSTIVFDTFGDIRKLIELSKIKPIPGWLVSKFVKQTVLQLDKVNETLFFTKSAGKSGYVYSQHNYDDMMGHQYELNILDCSELKDSKLFRSGRFSEWFMEMNLANEIPVIKSVRGLKLERKKAEQAESKKPETQLTGIAKFLTTAMLGKIPTSPKFLTIVRKGVTEVYTNEESLFNEYKKYTIGQKVKSVDSASHLIDILTAAKLLPERKKYERSESGIKYYITGYRFVATEEYQKKLQELQ